MEIVLSWDLSETFMMGINLGEIFGGSQTVDDVLAKILGDITPESGGEINFGTKLDFRFGFGVKIENGVSSCFVLGNSGLDLGFTGTFRKRESFFLIA
jgi:hypothetical protein